jgi:hypothetical protein
MAPARAAGVVVLRLTNEEVFGSRSARRTNAAGAGQAVGEGAPFERGSDSTCSRR